MYTFRFLHSMYVLLYHFRSVELPSKSLREQMTRKQKVKEAEIPLIVTLLILNIEQGLSLERLQ